MNWYIVKVHSISVYGNYCWAQKNVKNIIFVFKRFVLHVNSKKFIGLHCQSNFITAVRLGIHKNRVRTQFGRALCDRFCNSQRNTLFSVENWITYYFIFIRKKSICRYRHKQSLFDKNMNSPVSDSDSYINTVSLGAQLRYTGSVMFHFPPNNNFS